MIFFLKHLILLQIRIINFFYKKKIIFSNYLSEYFELDLYKKKKINNKNFLFYCPNRLIEWRVHDILNKEPNTISWIDSFSGKKIVFWDIGSNIGSFSIYAASKHKQNISIYSFEPSTSNLRVLSRNISINKLSKKIKIIPLPLFEKDLDFNIMNESRFVEGSALHTFSKKYNFRGKKFIIKNKYNILGTSINFLLKNKKIEYPNYIKLDVDGLEHLILRGSSYLLKSSFRPKEILIELNESFAYQFHRVKNILKLNNYQLIKNVNSKNEFLFRYKK
jgi:FkbM family methyltransferase